MLSDDTSFDAFVTHVHADCFASLELEPGGALAESLDKCYTPSECRADYAGCRKKHVCALLHGARPTAFEACVACASSASSAATESTAILDPTGCDASALAEGAASHSSSSSSSSSSTTCTGSPFCGLQRYADSHMHGRVFVFLFAVAFAAAMLTAYQRQMCCFTGSSSRRRRGEWSEKGYYGQHFEGGDGGSRTARSRSPSDDGPQDAWVYAKAVAAGQPATTSYGAASPASADSSLASEYETASLLSI